MTKQEAKDTGINRGTAYANGISENILRNDLDNDMRDDIKRSAAGSAIDAGFRTVDSANAVAFIDGFVHACNRRFLERRNELPDIKAEQWSSHINRRLSYNIETAQATLAKFQERLTVNPLDAFEWSEGAFEAAAKLGVAKHLMDIIAEDRDEGINKAIAFARRRMLEGARWPSRSTSDASNLAKQYTTAAYAEFVAESEL